MSAIEFLNKIYQIENVHKVIDEIYDFMDDHLRAGNFAICSEVLEAADLTRLDPSAILSFLIVSRRAKHCVTARAIFAAKATDFIEESILKKYV